MIFDLFFNEYLNVYKFKKATGIQSIFVQEDSGEEVEEVLTHKIKFKTHFYTGKGKKEEEEKVETP